MFGLNQRPEISPRNITMLEGVEGEVGEEQEVVEEPDFCGFYNPDFIIYSSLGSFYIPCMVMVVLYSRIFKVTLVLL